MSFSKAQESFKSRQRQEGKGSLQARPFAFAHGEGGHFWPGHEDRSFVFVWVPLPHNCKPRDTFVSPAWVCSVMAFWMQMDMQLLNLKTKAESHHLKSVGIPLRGRGCWWTDLPDDALSSSTYQSGKSHNQGHCPGVRLSTGVP